MLIRKQWQEKIFKKKTANEANEYMQRYSTTLSIKESWNQNARPLDIQNIKDGWYKCGHRCEATGTLSPADDVYDQYKHFGNPFDRIFRNWTCAKVMAQQ